MAEYKITQNGETEKGRGSRRLTEEYCAQKKREDPDLVIDYDPGIVMPADGVRPVEKRLGRFTGV